MITLRNRREREIDNPVAFGERIAKALGGELEAWQADFLRLANTSLQTLLLAARQAGKSFITALLATWTAIYIPKSLIVVISPSLRQSLELHLKIKAAMFAANVEIRDQSELRTILANGNRIVCVPANSDTLRGFSPTLLIFDEGAHVPDEVFYVSRPMLASTGGSLVAISSAWVKAGWFHANWSNDSQSWARMKITALESKRISSEWLREEKRTLPDFIYRSQYLCEFVNPVDSLFRTEDIEAALDDRLMPIEW